MKIKKVICADEGKILTNGEIYGRMIFLADDMTEDGFYEITVEEYERITDEAVEDEEI